MAWSILPGIVLASLIANLGPPLAARASPTVTRAGAQRQAVSSRQRSGLNARHALLYVASEADNTVTIYDLSAIGDPVVQQITTGIDSPGNISLDQNATLYVANGNTRSVTVYPFGQTSPTLTMSDGMTDPSGVAVTSNGTAYVPGRGSPAVIDVYPAGASSPSQVITDPLISVPSQAIADSDNNVYVADNATGVYELAAGSSQPVSLNLQALTGATGIALDEEKGRLFVSTVGNGNHFLDAYMLGSPDQLYHVPSVNADTIAFGSRHFDYVFVPDFFGYDLQIYTPRSHKPIGSLSVTYNPQGVAYKPPHVPKATAARGAPGLGRAARLL